MNSRAAPLPQVLAAAALGALQTLAFVHTALWWLSLLCMAALAALVWQAAPQRAALLGWAFGSAWAIAWLLLARFYDGRSQRRGREGSAEAQ